MKNMFSLPLVLLSAATDLTAGGGAGTETPTPAPVEKAKRKAKPQHTITVEESDKEMLKLIQGEFYGPQASNPDEKRFLSTNEAFRIVMELATRNRFGPDVEMVQQVDDNGQPVFTDEENPVPVMVESPVDNFATEAGKIIAARDMGRKTATVSRLEAQIAALKAELAAKESAPVVEVESTETVEA